MRQSVGLQYLQTNSFNQDCVENVLSIIRGKGDLENPWPKEISAAYHAAADDSIFVVSHQSNPKDDVDNFLLNLTTITNHQGSYNDDSNEATHDYKADLVRIANAFCLTLPEIILIYIAVSNIGFIMGHGHNDGYITPYTDIEFELTTYHEFYELLSQNIITNVQRNNIIDNDKTCRTDGIRTIFHNDTISRLYIERQNKNTTLQCT